MTERDLIIEEMIQEADQLYLYEQWLLSIPFIEAVHEGVSVEWLSARFNYYRHLHQVEMNPDLNLDLY